MMSKEQRGNVGEIAEAITDLAHEEPGVDLSSVTNAVDRAKREYKERIERALRGIADLEQLKPRKAKQFFVAYWYNNASYVAQGVEFPAPSKDKESYVETVRIEGSMPSLRSSYVSMDTLREHLKSLDLPYHLAYFKDDK